MCQWKWHWPMTCDFPYKKDNKKTRLFLLHIDVDSRSPVDNAVLYMISMPWLVLVLCRSLE